MKGKILNYPEFVNRNEIAVENYGFDTEKFRFVLRVPFKTSGDNYLRVIMKNPSKANEHECDRTMMKVCNASHFAGFDGVIVLNLFPYRATKASDLYEEFCIVNSQLYEDVMQKNREIIREVCTDSEVVFAWGTNTIHKSAAFDKIYDDLAKETEDYVVKFAAHIMYTEKENSKHPLHALRWWNDILSELCVVVKNKEPDKKHLVLHHNMFGPTAQVGNTNTEDLKIYCYKRNKVCCPDCNGCRYFRGNEMGNGIACEWEDFDGNISENESIVQHYENYLEYDRVQYAKHARYKADVDKYVDYLKNYEK